MTKKLKPSMILAFVVAFVVSFAEIPGQAQTGGAKPNLNGIWQALNAAGWDIQDHTGQLGVPPGQGVVEGNEIPYQPQALKKKQDNYAKRMTADPTETNCFLPGVPRATYMSYPFEIVQTPNHIAIRRSEEHTSE